MAATVALPPFSALRADLAGSKFTDSEPDTLPSILCGFGSRLSCVKTEPGLDECMDSFCNNTYTELTSATFSQLKQGQTDLYSNSADDQTFSSWTYIHPEHWEAREVLDWVFSLTETENFDGACFRGEAYNTLTGKQLCSMTLADFISLDEHYGARVYEVFQMLLRHANFKKPSPPESMKYEFLSGNVPDFATLECSNDVTPARAPTPPVCSSSISIFLDKNNNDMKVSLDGLGLYDIDITLTGCYDFDNINESDYSSGSDADNERSHSVSSDTVSERMFTDDEDSSDVVIPDLTRHTRTPSSSSDSGNESDDRRHSRRPRAPSASKGNHLWEFVRDLLKDSRFNPSLVKWEDEDMGVFKFVQSEAVAQMWGRKKNNPGMTYEKLSRAMRFCRTAGYFDNVPRTGRFPKKLCFKFGPKAHDWH
ncbi:ETS-related transcription factor Elf-5-like [Babylonia areolata]|uniref:ETS-related transcription factor Elf-5-like n=1 Tax=Babylonia areolata TaxID=304850 RepID=UPI003FD20D8B